MKTRSCKNKGARLQNFIVDNLRKKFKADQDAESRLEGIIQSNPMGNSGRDVKLAGWMQDELPFDIEAKNCETWSVPQWWRQTVENTGKNRKPLLVMKKNRHPVLVVMRFEDWLDLL